MSSFTDQPNADGSKGSWIEFVPSFGNTTNIYLNIDEGTTSPNDSDYISGPYNAGAYFPRFPSMPGGFGTGTGLSFIIRAQYSSSKLDNKSFNAQVYQSDETTAITNSITTALSSSFSNYTLNFTITGATTKTVWDGMRLKLTPMTGSTGGSTFISAIDRTVTYSAPAGGLFTMSNLCGLSPCGPKNFNRLERIRSGLWLPKRPSILVPAMILAG